MSQQDWRRGPWEQWESDEAEEAAAQPLPSPGKRTLTMGLRRPPGASPSAQAPVQQQHDSGAPLQRKQQASYAEQWMDVAIRPDLNEPPVQRKSAQEQDDQASASMPAGGGGQPMPEDVQSKMEHAFAADFSAVRVHEGAHAKAIGALAYTQGTDIHFAPGMYDPGSRSGQELLGHELTHVVQQSQGRVAATAQAKGLAINDDASLEQEADVMGARAARGQQASGLHGGAVASQTLQMSAASGGIERPVQRTPDEDGSSDGDKLAVILEHIEQDKWDVDSLVAELTDAEMAAIPAGPRARILRYVANGWSVGNDDELSIVRLLATTPAGDAAAMMTALRAENAALLQRLESVIHGDEYKQYLTTLRDLYFQSLSPEQASQAMDSARELPWSDPGLIEAIWNVRFYYEECEFTDEGKIRITYWTNLAFMGTKTVEGLELDPTEMVAVRFFRGEADMGTTDSQVVFMPAAAFLGLYNKQFKNEMGTVVDVALLAAGGAGLINATTKVGRVVAALELTLAAADMVIREFRNQIAETSEGKEFLRVWDKVQLLIMVYSLGRVAAEIPNVFRQLKAAFTRLKSGGKTDPGALAGMESKVDELVDGAEEVRLAQQLPTAGAKPETLSKIQANLDDVQGHTHGTNFIDRAEKSTGQGVLKLTNNKPIAANKTVALQPLPDAPPGKSIVSIEVLDESGAALGKLKAESSSLGTSIKIPSDPPARVKIRTKDGDEIIWAADTPPPQGFRLEIQPSGEFRNRGFSGGHTREAWEQTKTIYGDMIQESSQTKLGFKVPGTDKMEVSLVEYKVKVPGKSGGTEWADVKHPKTLFEGSGNASIKAFEEHMSPYVAAAYDKALPLNLRQLDVSVPVFDKTGALTTVDIVVTLDRPGGSITSWWISQTNASKPNLLVP